MRNETSITTSFSQNTSKQFESNSPNTVKSFDQVFPSGRNLSIVLNVCFPYPNCHQKTTLSDPKSSIDILKFFSS